MRADEDFIADEIRRARSEGVTNAENLPFYLPADGEHRGAVLLVHGFSATPREMRPLAEHLARRGSSCLAVRLPGHGPTPEDLAGRRWEEWADTVIRGYDLLGSRHRPVFAAGMSTGALLLLALARQRSPRGLILLSPYLRLRHRLAPLAGLLRFLLPYQRRALPEDEARYYYARRPVAGVHQINRLIRGLRPQLPEIGVPVLAFHGEGDRTVDIDSGFELLTRLGSPLVVYQRLGPEAGHVLVGSGNPHRETVFDLSSRFIAELEDQRCPAEART